VAAHEVKLQGAQLFRRDLVVGELTEARVDAVDDAPLGDDAFHHLARRAHPRARRRRESGLLQAVCDPGDLFERKFLAVEFEHRKIRGQSSEVSS
jgi:hypothetical protein